MKKILLSAAMFATIAGVMLMTSCKKQQDTIVKKDAAPFEQGVSGSEQKIIDFIDSYSAFKKGAKVEGESVSLEEARWQWETTLNYCYGFTQTSLNNMIRDTIYLKTPKTDITGCIAYIDMLSMYDDILESVCKVYKNIDMEDKVLQFVMIQVGKKASKDDTEKIAVIINTGRNTSGESEFGTNPWCGSPFDYYNYPVFKSAQLIDSVVQSYDMSHSIFYMPCPDCTTYLEDITEVAYYYFPVDSWTFHTDCMPMFSLYNYWLTAAEMNQIYIDVMNHTHYPGMVINPYNIFWYYKVIVEGQRISCENGEFYYRHIVHVLNCTRRMRHAGDGNVYPIPIDEFER